MLWSSYFDRIFCPTSGSVTSPRGGPCADPAAWSYAMCGRAGGRASQLRAGSRFAYPGTRVGLASGGRAFSSEAS